MKLLTEYRRNGNDFKLTARRGNAAVFRCDDLADFSPYEVIVIQSHNGREIMGNTIPPAEYPPSDAQWGSLGWTVKSTKEALEMMVNLALPEVPS